jgi:hypothetical protein
MRTMLKIFYTLEMYIQPGGGRDALVFIANSIDEIKAAVQLQLANKFNLSFLLDIDSLIKIYNQVTAYDRS